MKLGKTALHIHCGALEVGVLALQGLMFGQFPHWVDVMVPKGMIFCNFHFGSMWWSYKDQFGMFPLWGNGDFERTYFVSFDIGRV